VGFVVASEDTYLIPTVFDADGKPLAELADEIGRLSTAATAGRLASPAFSGATFTLWDATPDGVSSASIPVVPPQAAAIATGALRDVPTLRGRELITVTTMTATLACDHRILYGARAVAFLAAVKSRLEQARL
jgi:pyruvate dehydrogenase E2 component (dihydrolipoamide acetyltransferase)